MKFPASSAANVGLNFHTPSANGGSLVNDYTVIFDVLYPATSDAKVRPLLQTSDGNTAGVAEAAFGVGANNGVGVLPNETFGSIKANTWYRIGIVHDSAAVQSIIYINGAKVGIAGGGAVDGVLALPPDSVAQLFNNNAINSAGGYVNSIQVRDSALNAGQIAALGGPAATGIAQVIPPVAAFISARSPDIGAGNVPPLPDLSLTLNRGDSTVTDSSIKLFLDNVQVDATVTPNGDTYDITYTVTNILGPLSIHQMSLVSSDSIGGLQTNTSSFTIARYQNVTLPTPFYLETFDSLTEDSTGPGPLPAGWTVANQTSVQGVDYDMDSRSSKSYEDWVLVSGDRFASWDSDRTALPPIVLNGVLLDTLVSGNLMWAESDQRCGGCVGQYQEMYTADINCTGKTNIYVAWKSIYEQNQDNMNAVEYSIDGGNTWFPVLYLFCTQGAGEQSDILYKDAAVGAIGTVIDVAATFARTDNNTPWGPTNYGGMIKAPISDALAPYMKGYLNDDARDGKRIEVVRLPQADGQAKVRFRFLDDGTSSWFWGIDDFGLYEINTPVITSQPTSTTVAYGGTATLKVVATAGQMYQWFFNGLALTGQTTDTLTLNNVTGDNSGSYKVTITNKDGSVTSDTVTLTVIVAPIITTQPADVLASAGAPVSFSVIAQGKTPFTYQWQKDGTNITGATGSTYSIGAAAVADSGNYLVTVSNDSGSVPSSAAHLTVLPLVPITQDLVVHLPFDGDANDTSGRGNNGTPQGQPETGGNPPTFPTTGSRVGTAFMHLADGQHVLLGQPDDLNFGADVNFTFAYWVKGPATGSSSGDPSYIANKNWTSGGNPGLVVAAQGGGTFKENWKAASGPRRDSTSFGNVTDGNWHHVVISHDRTGVAYFYVDGVLKGTMPIAGDGDINSLDYYIGQDGTGRYGFDNDTGAHFLDISFDDFGIWRRILTPQEIASIYAHGLTGEDLTKASGEVVILPPNITVGPVTQVVSPGANVTLSATIEGTAPFTYQWQKNGNPITDATSATLTLNNFDASAAGDYRLVATNSKGNSTSSAAHLVLSSATSLSQDLVVYLKFDGNYSDSSGRNNNATPKGPSPDFAAGKLGQAFHFITKKDGSVINYATLGAPTDLLFGTGDFTVSMWVSYTDQSDDPAFISDKDWGSSSNIGWGIFSQEEGNFRVSDTGTPRGGDNKMNFTSSGPSIAVGWHHILVSFWRGEFTQTYLDGQLLNSTPLTIIGSVDTADQGFAINIGQDGKGTYTDGGSAQIDGLIDDVAIWRRIVTPQEDAAIYAAGAAGQDLGSLTGTSGNQPRLGIPSISGSTITITWTGTGTFQLQKRTDLGLAGAWEPVGTTTTGNSATDTIGGGATFYRVHKL